MKKEKFKGKKTRENDLIGMYKNLPWYSLVGNPSDFYIFRRRNRKEFGSFSGWVKGQPNLWFKLKQVSGKECVELCDQILQVGKNPLGNNDFKLER
jgi:hypothetical protein